MKGDYNMISFKDIIITGVRERELPAEGKLHFMGFTRNAFAKRVRVYNFESCHSGRWLKFATHPVDIKSGGLIFDSGFDIIDYCEKEECDFFFLEEGGIFSSFGGVYELKKGKLHKIAPEERWNGIEYHNSIDWI
jgi:hypothetical protein